MFKNFYDEQKKVEKEILGLDKGSEQNNEEKDDDCDEDGDVPEGLINQREEYIMSQAKINKEILVLNKHILFLFITVCFEHINHYDSQYILMFF